MHRFRLCILLLLPIVISTSFSGYASIPDTSSKARIELLFQLPLEVHESSGLIYFQNIFWTFNDSGGEPVIYGIDPVLGKIIRKITISNASNIDWEEATQDSNFIYIGDFGNNFGNRKDLRIYRLSKNRILNEKSDISLKADIISFRFADQKDYSKNLYSTPYDCEAMIIWGDSIIIFSKNWKEETSSVYCIPKVPGDYAPALSFVFRSQGLVTGAALSDNKRELAIIGYAEFIPFLWIIEMNNSIDFRKNKKSRKSFISMSGVQTEGICYGPDGYLYISCEHSLVTQSLYRINRARIRKLH